MKIETTITPRRDGTVRLMGVSGSALVFSRDEQGALSAEVTDDRDIAQCLTSGNFVPADEADFAIASLLTEQNAEDNFVDDGNVIGETEDLDDDDVPNMDAAPVEEPIAPLKPAKKAK